MREMRNLLFSFFCFTQSESEGEINTLVHFSIALPLPFLTLLPSNPYFVFLLLTSLPSFLPSLLHTPTPLAITLLIPPQLLPLLLVLLFSNPILFLLFISPRSILQPFAYNTLTPSLQLHIYFNLCSIRQLDAVSTSFLLLLSFPFMNTTSSVPASDPLPSPSPMQALTATGKTQLCQFSRSFHPSALDISFS